MSQAARGTRPLTDQVEAWLQTVPRGVTADELAPALEISLRQATVCLFRLAQTGRAHTQAEPRGRAANRLRYFALRFAVRELPQEPERPKAAAASGPGAVPAGQPPVPATTGELPAERRCFSAMPPGIYLHLDSAIARYCQAKAAAAPARHRGRP